MSVRDLIPWGRSRSSVPAAGAGSEFSPFLTLHREVNRLFDDVFNGFETGTPSVFGRISWPSLEVSATEKEVRVSAELPGLEQKDVELLVDGDVLTIRGEKRSETEDKGRHFSERYYGRFERSLALPFEVEEDKAQATFKNGVLTVTLPKSARAAERAKRIPISGGDATKH
jgi:HSP20 family protein